MMLAVRALTAAGGGRTSRRVFSVRSDHHHDGDDAGVRAVLRGKRLFAVGLGGSTLLAALWLRRRKDERVRELLQDCVKVPISEGHFESSVAFYRYSGTVLPGQIVMSGVLQQLPHFQFRDTDVLVASFPKAGTTWVQEIVYMLTHGCRASTDADPTLETRFPYLEYPYPGLRSVAAQTGPRCIKTHLPYHLLPESVHAAGTKIVYVTRNPRDTAVSYYHFVRLLATAGFTGTFDDFIDDFLQNKVAYSPFWSHVRAYHQSCRVGGENGSVLIVSYEDLSMDPAAVVRSIAQHLGVAVSEEDVHYVVSHTSFQAMASNKSVNYEHWKDMGFAHADRGNFIRKGKVGDWETSLTKDQVLRFQEWERINRQPLDFPFVYRLQPSEADR